MYRNTIKRWSRFIGEIFRSLLLLGLAIIFFAVFYVVNLPETSNNKVQAMASPASSMFNSYMLDNVVADGNWTGWETMPTRSTGPSWVKWTAQEATVYQNQKPFLMTSKAVVGDYEKYTFNSWYLRLLVPKGETSSTINFRDLCFSGWDFGTAGYGERFEIQLEGSKIYQNYDSSASNYHANAKAHPYSYRTGRLAGKGFLECQKGNHARVVYNRNSNFTPDLDPNIEQSLVLDLSSHTPSRTHYAAVPGQEPLYNIAGNNGAGLTQDYDEYKLTFLHTDTDGSYQYMNSFYAASATPGHYLVGNEAGNYIGFSSPVPGWDKQSTVNDKWQITFEVASTECDQSETIQLTLVDNDQNPAVTGTVWEMERSDYFEALTSGGAMSFTKNSALTQTWQNEGEDAVDPKPLTLEPTKVYRIMFSGLRDQNILGFGIPSDPANIRKCHGQNDLTIGIGGQYRCELYVKHANLSTLGSGSKKNVNDIEHIELFLARKTGPTNSPTYTTIESLEYKAPPATIYTSQGLANKIVNPLRNLEPPPKSIPNDRVFTDLNWSKILDPTETDNTDYKGKLNELVVVVKAYWAKDSNGVVKKVSLSASDYLVVENANLPIADFPKTQADCQNEVPTAIIRVLEPCKNATGTTKVPGWIRLDSLEWVTQPTAKIEITVEDKSSNKISSASGVFDQTTQSSSVQYLLTPFTIDDYDRWKPLDIYLTGYKPPGQSLKKFQRRVGNSYVNVRYPATINYESQAGQCASPPPRSCTQALSNSPPGEYQTKTYITYPKVTRTKSISYDYHDGGTQTFSDSYGRDVWTGQYQQICTGYSCQTINGNKVCSCNGYRNGAKIYQWKSYAGYPVSRTGKSISTVNATVKYEHGKVSLDMTKVKEDLIKSFKDSSTNNHERDTSTTLVNETAPVIFGMASNFSGNRKIDPDKTVHKSITGDTQGRIAVRKSPQPSDFHLEVKYKVKKGSTTWKTGTVTWSSNTDSTGISKRLEQHDDSPYLHSGSAPNVYEWEMKWKLKIKQKMIYDWNYDQTLFSDNAYSTDSVTENSGIAASQEYSRSMTYTGKWNHCTRTLIVEPPECSLGYNPDSLREYRFFNRTTENGTSGRKKTSVYPVGRSVARTRIKYINTNKFDLKTTNTQHPTFSVVQHPTVYASGHNPGITDVSSNPKTGVISANSHLYYKETARAINYPGKYVTSWVPKWSSDAKNKWPSGAQWAGDEHLNKKCEDTDNNNAVVDLLTKDVYIWADPPTCRVEYTVFEKTDDANIKIKLTNPNHAPMVIDRDNYTVYERPYPSTTTNKITGQYLGSTTTIPATASVNLSSPRFKINVDGEYFYAWDIQTSIGNEAWTTKNNSTGQRSWFEYRKDPPNEERIQSIHVSPNDPDNQCREILRIVVRPYVKVFYSSILAGGRFGERDERDACADFTDPYIIGHDSNIDGYVAAHANAATPTTFVKGSSSAYDTNAYDEIDGLYTASQRDNTTSGPHPKPLKGLTLGNVDSSKDFGGQFSKDICIANYWRQIDKSAPRTTNTLDLATGVAQLPFNGERLYYKLNSLTNKSLASRTLTISNSAAGSDLEYSKGTIYVDGNIYITDDIINNENYIFTHPSQLGYLILVARGNIYIDPSVQRIDALLVAYPEEGLDRSNSLAIAKKGKLFTCMKLASNWSRSTHYASCKNKLTINGALVAQTVKLGRIHETVLLAKTPKDTPADNNASEVINVLPEYLLAQPELPLFPDWIYTPDSTATIPLNF